MVICFADLSFSTQPSYIARQKNERNICLSCTTLISPKYWCFLYIYAQSMPKTGFNLKVKRQCVQVVRHATSTVKTHNARSAKIHTRIFYFFLNCKTAGLENVSHCPQEHIPQSWPLRYAQYCIDLWRVFFVCLF